MSFLPLHLHKRKKPAEKSAKDTSKNVQNVIDFQDETDKKKGKRLVLQKKKFEIEPRNLTIWQRCTLPESCVFGPLSSFQFFFLSYFFSIKKYSSAHNSLNSHLTFFSPFSTRKLELEKLSGKELLSKSAFV